MASRSTSRSGLFLLEMMLVILFFSLTSAICVRLFAQAHLTSVHSTALTQAMLHAQSAAELFRNTGDRELLAHTLEGEWVGDTLTCHLDANWSPASQEKAAYTLTLCLDTKSPGLTYAQIEIVDRPQESPLFALRTARTGDIHLPTFPEGGNPS